MKYAHDLSSEMAKQLSRDAAGLAARLSGLVTKWAVHVTGDVRGVPTKSSSEFKIATKITNARTCLFEIDEPEIEQAIVLISRCHAELELLLTPQIEEESE